MKISRYKMIWKSRIRWQKSTNDLGRRPKVISSPLPIIFKIWQSTIWKMFCTFSVITYVFLFGPSIKPLYHRCLVWPTSVCDRPRHKKEEEEVILFHNCVLTPDVIRSEVEYFKLDFNNRIKQVLFNSLLTAYYMTFVPLCFAQVSLVCHRCVKFVLVCNDPYETWINFPITNWVATLVIVRNEEPTICGKTTPCLLKWVMVDSVFIALTLFLQWRSIIHLFLSDITFS